MPVIFNYTDRNDNLKPAPSWASKITRRIGEKLFGLEGPQPQPKLTDGSSATDNLVGSADHVITQVSSRVGRERKSVYDDIEEMDSNDELVATALDVIADRAFAFIEEDSLDRIRIKTEDKNVQKILEELIKRVDLQHDVWQLGRETVKHGSIFREPLVDRNQKDPKVLSLKQTVPWQIWPNTTKKGDKIPGWIVRDEQALYTDGGQRLDEWQIIPFLYGTKYGYLHVGPLASARRNWYRINKSEDSLAEARATRSFDKLVHRVPVQSTWLPAKVMEAIRMYRDNATKKRMVSGTTDSYTSNQGPAPMDVQTDFYLPDDGSGRGGVDILSGTNNQLMNLTDLYYLREKLLARLKVPIQFLQIQSTQKTHVASSGGPNVDIQFASVLRGVQAVVHRGLKRLFDLELLLQGVANAEYEIQFARIDTVDRMQEAKILLTRAQAAAYFNESFGVLPPETLTSLVLPDLNEEQKKLFDDFAKGDGAKIKKLRIKTMEEASKPKPAAGASGIGGGKLKDRVVGGDTGSGNNNKSRAKRSGEQKGSSVQSVDIEDVVTLVQRTQAALGYEPEDADIITAEILSSV
jgi:hypothetical protein